MLEDVEKSGCFPLQTGSITPATWRHKGVCRLSPVANFIPLTFIEKPGVQMLVSLLGRLQFQL